jgi:hypothetical protein
MDILASAVSRRSPQKLTINGVPGSVGVTSGRIVAHSETGPQTGFESSQSAVSHTEAAAKEAASMARKQKIAKQPKPKTVLRLPDLVLLRAPACIQPHGRSSIPLLSGGEEPGARHHQRPPGGGAEARLRGFGHGPAQPRPCGRHPAGERREAVPQRNLAPNPSCVGVVTRPNPPTFPGPDSDRGRFPAQHRKGRPGFAAALIVPPRYRCALL